MKNFIKYKRTLLMSLISIIFLIGLIYLVFNIVKQQAIGVEKEKLQILANEKATQVNMFLEFQKEKFNIISLDVIFEEVVKDSSNPAKIELAKELINELKHVIPRIGVFTKEGVMFIAESGPVPIDYSAIPYFSSKDKEIIFMRYYDEYQKKDYYSILGPIYDNIEKDNVIGAIAFDIELDKISLLLKEAGHSEENSEVYLIDEIGLLLSNSKYIGNNNKHGILIQKIESEGAEACIDELEKYKKNGVIKEREEDVVRYKNYMGDEVYGAHAYVPEIRGCVIAEKSTDEILRLQMLDYFKLNN